MADDADNTSGDFIFWIYWNGTRYILYKKDFDIKTRFN